VGKNKLAKFAAMAHFDNVFQPTYDALSVNGFPLRNKWASGYFGNNAPIVLELGCGKGEYTVTLAEKYRDKNFIGVDIKGARMFTGAKQAILRGLNNAAFVRTKIENTDYLFGPGEISEIWLTFPDPQMKNPQKRLTSSWFINRYQKFMIREGIIHLKTDSHFQYQYTLALANLNRFKILGHTDNLYGSELLNEVLSIPTFYEKQWLERGLNIKYIAFEPGEKTELEEPEEAFEKDNYRSFGRKGKL
jgi:tRNA (guanine-N7-)-methyltransferase